MYGSLESDKRGGTQNEKKIWNDLSKWIETKSSTKTRKNFYWIYIELSGNKWFSLLKHKKWTKKKHLSALKNEQAPNNISFKELIAAKFFNL